MELKNEHYIYIENFKSTTEFTNELYRFIDNIEKREEKLTELLDTEIYNWKNDETREEYYCIIEKALEITKDAKESLREIKEEIK